MDDPDLTDLEDEELDEDQELLEAERDELGKKIMGKREKDEEE